MPTETDTSSPGPSCAELQRQIDAAIAQTVAADAKAGALLTAAGLLAAMLTAVGPSGAKAPGWFAALEATAVAPAVTALILLLLALRPRLPNRPDAAPSFITHVKQPVNYLAAPPTPHALATRRQLVAGIATRKHRLIASAVDCLIAAVALAALTLTAALAA